MALFQNSFASFCLGIFFFICCRDWFCFKEKKDNSDYVEFNLCNEFWSKTTCGHLNCSSCLEVKVLISQYELHKISSPFPKSEEIVITQLAGKLIHYKAYENTDYQSPLVFCFLLFQSPPHSQERQWYFAKSYKGSFSWLIFGGKFTPQTHPNCRHTSTSGALFNSQRKMQDFK